MIGHGGWTMEFTAETAEVAENRREMCLTTNDDNHNNSSCFSAVSAFSAVNTVVKVCDASHDAD